MMSSPQPLRRAALLAAALLVAGCKAIVDKPERATLYDLGPGPAPAATPAQVELLVLADVEANGVLEGTGLFYRLGYVDNHQLRSYAQSRWSQPLPQMVRQRLADQLGRDRLVLAPADAAALVRPGGAMRVLRLELQEFAQHFVSATESRGQLRLRATLQQGAAGERPVLQQRVFVVSRPAPTGDAPGGVRALGAALDAAAVEIAQWLGEASPAAAPGRAR
jgi:cholesterol transport system auxiliary component